MRIESPQVYKYFFQIMKEEPLEIRRYSLILLSIAILFLSVVFNKDSLLLLFLLSGYGCMMIGYAIARYTHSLSLPPLKKRIYEKLLLANQKDIVVLRNRKSNKITFVNEAFYRTFGEQYAANEGINLLDFVADEDVRKFRKKPHRMLAIKPYHNDSKMVRIKKADGNTEWAEVQTQVLDDQLELYTFRNTHLDEMQKKSNAQFSRELSERYFNEKQSFTTKEIQSLSDRNSYLRVV